MNAILFLDPRIARTTPDPKPLTWDRGPDVRALAAYIRAWIRQHHKNPDHGHRP